MGLFELWAEIVLTPQQARIIANNPYAPYSPYQPRRGFNLSAATTVSKDDFFLVMG
jgi:hypothetical protein